MKSRREAAILMPADSRASLSAGDASRYFRSQSVKVVWAEGGNDSPGIEDVVGVGSEDGVAADPDSFC
ncbi:MAG: hypothetical protein ACC661_04895 [Verrucomicrobiales bacterium]